MTGVLLAAMLQVEAPFGKYEILVPEFGQREFSVAEYGAKADGTKCTEAFAAAMAACEQAGGGRVVVLNRRDAVRAKICYNNSTL